MILRETKRLSLYERKQLQDLINKKTEFGIVICDLIASNSKYKGTLTVPHTFEMSNPYIQLVNKTTNESYTKELPNLNILGTWEINCGLDNVILEIK